MVGARISPGKKERYRFIYPATKAQFICKQINELVKLGVCKPFKTLTVTSDRSNGGFLVTILSYIPQTHLCLKLSPS